MLASVGMSGEPFAGADIGGFANGRPDGELLTRWYQVGFLSPFFRNHSEIGIYDHEPWRFGAQYEDIIRKYLKLRYRLLPYLNTVMEEAHRTGVSIFRPLVLNYQDDPNTVNIDDEFMVGDDLLAAPVLKSDQTSRPVYLPKGVWWDYWTGELVKGGRMIRAEAPLEIIPLFIRGGAVIPLGPEQNWTCQKALNPITLPAHRSTRTTASVRHFSKAHSGARLSISIGARSRCGVPKETGIRRRASLSFAYTQRADLSEPRRLRIAAGPTGFRL
jgi:alpha-glucosidase